MTTEEQKLALLEWAGWKRDGCDSDQERWKDGTLTFIGNLAGTLSSLDVIAEFENKLKKQMLFCYIDNLCLITNGPTAESDGSYKEIGAMLLATAPQRLEALVRTLGLWREK